MKVTELMTKDVCTCSSNDTLHRAAQIMSEKDCGVVPIEDEHGRTVGVVTDRDICMAALVQDKPLSQIPVASAASKDVVCARPDDSVEASLGLMQTAQIRRIPVVDGDGRTVGVVSLDDIVRSFSQNPTEEVSADAIARTFAAIVQPPRRPADAECPEPAPAPSRSPVYRVKSIDGGWEVYDREGKPVSEMFMAQSDAVVHAKELAHRDGSAQIIVHAQDGSILSEFFYQRDERSSLSFDDSLPTFAASRPARARGRTSSRG